MAVRLALATLLVLSVVSVPAAGAADRTLHVAVDGDDDGDGSAARPWATILLAMEQLRPGDTLLLHGGVYEQRVETLRPLPRGTAEDPITVRSAPGERATIRRLNVFKGGLHHWVVEDLTVEWDTGAPNEALVRLVDGVGWTLRGVEVRGNRSYAGVRVMTETLGMPSDWRITESCVHTTAAVNPFNQDHNLYVSAHGGPGRIDHNVLYGAPNGSNVKLGAGLPTDRGAERVVVEDNLMAGAMHNVLVAWRSTNNTVRNNLLLRGRVNLAAGDPRQAWYPNVRGQDMAGTDNVVQDNLGHGPGFVVDHRLAGPGFVDLGGNAAVSSAVDLTVDCDGATGAAGTALLDGRVQRVAGADRLATAVALSREAHDRADTVVLARFDAYPDALSAAPLAHALGGPILLTPPSALDERVAGEIERLGADEVVLVGGTAAISEPVAATLRAAGLDVRRVSGADRWATAAAIHDELDSREVVLVQGRHADPARGWADAVGAAPLAAVEGRSILLTATDRLPGPTERALRDVDDVLVVGGEAAVSADVERRAARGRGLERIAGDDRYDTSARVASRHAGALDTVDRVWVATGRNWPDALAAGPVVAATGGVLVLSDPSTLPPPVAKQVARHADRPSVLVGGSRTLDGVLADLARLSRR